MDAAAVSVRDSESVRLKIGRVIQRIARPASILALSLTLFVVVVLSPMALRVIGNLRGGMDWGQLSNIGQTYGAASALLSAMALAGIGISVVLQAKELLAARRLSTRTLHIELLRMAMEDPALLQCWGFPREGFTLDQSRQIGYFNLIFSHWEMLWELGDISEELMQVDAKAIFSNEIGRWYWREYGAQRDFYPANTHGKRLRQIFEDEFQLAAEFNPPTPARTDTSVGSAMGNWIIRPRDVAWIGTGALVTVVGGILFRRARG